MGGEREERGKEAVRWGRGQAVKLVGGKAVSSGEGREERWREKTEAVRLGR